MKNQKVSIIVRTKNEERWIDKCLAAIAEQQHKNHEVIVVDNDSTDATVAKAKAFAVKLVNISQFRPGEALNVGIRASNGDVIVCLSAHCIPTGPDWLGNLITPLADANVAGVYGRQEPLPFSDPQDKRDPSPSLVLTVRSSSATRSFTMRTRPSCAARGRSSPSTKR